MIGDYVSTLSEFSSCVHSEEDTEERFDNRGGKRSWLV